MVNEKLTRAPHLFCARYALPGSGNGPMPLPAGKMMPYETKMPYQAPYSPDSYRLRRRELFAGLLVYGALLVLAISL